MDLVYALAEAMPEADFRLWGEKVMGDKTLPPKPDNITLEGTYEGFETLPLDQADLWLYTSAWDGVPTMLLEVAMTGIPLVGSDAGGTTEVLQEGMAIAMAESASPQDWAEAIRTRLRDPDAARQAAARLRQHLIDTRTPDIQARALFDLLEMP